MQLITNPQLSLATVLYSSIKFNSSFSEKKFLKFFLRQVKVNRKDNNKDWPYVSPCGDEMNYIRCDDLPVVYQSIVYGKQSYFHFNFII